MLITVPAQLIEDALYIKANNEESRGKDSNSHKRWKIDKDEEWAHLEKYFKGLDFLHGTLLWHNSPYPVHTDVWHPDNKTNVLIPLHIEAPQKFFVFDQTFHGSCQWIPMAPSKSRSADSPDSHAVGRPADDDRVEGKTGSPLAAEHAANLPEEPSFYHGLTATMYDYQPGQGIVFNSYNLHATGKMDSGYYKSALALWFTNDVDEVVKVFEQVNKNV